MYSLRSPVLLLVNSYYKLKEQQGYLFRFSVLTISITHDISPPKNTPCVYSSHSSTQLNKKQCDTIESATITERNTFDPLRLWLTWEHRQTSAVLPATLTLLLQNKCVWKLQLKAFYLWIKTATNSRPNTQVECTITNSLSHFVPTLSTDKTQQVLREVCGTAQSDSGAAELGYAYDDWSSSITNRN